MIGTGDGVTRVFALAKTYLSGEQSYTRVIAKPVAGSVLAAVQGVPLRETIGFTVDAATGLVTFTDAPDVGVTITAGFAFDVPVRFDTDRISISISNFQAGHVPSVPVVELRL